MRWTAVAAVVFVTCSAGGCARDRTPEAVRQAYLREMGVQVGEPPEPAVRRYRPDNPF